MKNLDRFKFKGFYQDALYECFSFCDEFVKLVIDGNVVKVLRNEVLLMQSTGLKDKNDNLIYEGDLILAKDYPENVICKIEWKNYLAGFYAVGTDDDKDVLSYQLALECEIIGNIYENEALAKEHDLI